jgi:N-acetylmuramoyl-L-alanine amidase
VKKSIRMMGALLCALPIITLANVTPKPRRPKPYLSVNKMKPAKPRLAIVVIDPGHGGKDPGATGPKGIHEKNVVLSVAKDLRADLKKVPTIGVDMTRTTDHFVTLRGRLRKARRDKASVFVAIHADSFYKQTARGASVFALSDHGASSEAARWLANSENHAALGGTTFKNHSRAVKSVLLDLSQAATIKDSLILGQDVYQSLKHVTDMHSYHVEQAPFVVLKSPDIPSLLVEIGFISNPFEEKRLNSVAYQHKIAAALEKGIVKYLYQHPPRGSLIALRH